MVAWLFHLPTSRINVHSFFREPSVRITADIHKSIFSSNPVDRTGLRESNPCPNLTDYGLGEASMAALLLYLSGIGSPIVGLPISRENVGGLPLKSVMRLRIKMQFERIGVLRARSREEYAPPALRYFKKARS